MKKYVLLHRYLESGKISIVAFSDSKSELFDLVSYQTYFGSISHDYFVADNVISSLSLTWLKDRCLLNICKNVAEFLSVAEYAMLKKSYFKSSAWFEKAKNSAILGSEIIDNY